MIAAIYATMLLLCLAFWAAVILAVL